MAKLLLAIMVFMLATITVAIQRPSPDFILTGGKVFTANPASLYAEAIAIRGERVAAVGKSTEMAALAGPTQCANACHVATWPYATRIMRIR